MMTFSKQDEVVAGTGLKGIRLGTYHHYSREGLKGSHKGKECKSDGKAENGAKDLSKDSTTATAGSTLPKLPSSGACVH